MKKKARINISSAIRSRDTEPSEEESLSAEDLSRKKVREALELKRKGTPLSLEDLRREAMGNPDHSYQEHVPPKRVKLSAQKLSKNVSLETSVSERPAKRAVTNTNITSNPRSLRRKCRDAIFFKSDVEYQDYLLQEKDVHGLYPDLYDHLKVLYVSRKNIPSLLSLWDELEESGMDSCEAHLERAETLRQMNELDKAMLYLEKAQRVKPDSVIALRSLTITYKLKKDYELALHWGERWRQVSPGEAECSYQLGSIHHRVNSFELARNHLKRALELDPHHLTARSLLESIGFGN